MNYLKKMLLVKKKKKRNNSLLESYNNVITWLKNYFILKPLSMDYSWLYSGTQ